MGLLFILWLIVPLIFWPLWLWVTHWRPLRHVGTLHFLLYFFSIYLGAYAMYAAGGSRNTVFLISVLAYPFLALGGVLLVAFIGNRPLGVFAGRVPWQLPSRAERFTFRSVTLFLIGVFVLFLFVLGDRIPLLVLLADGQEAGQVARYAATKGYHEAFGQIGPLVWLSRILVDYFALFLLIYAYCRVKLGHASYKRFAVIALLLFVVTVAFNERYPLVKLVMYFAIIVLGFRRPRISAGTLWRVLLPAPLIFPLIGTIHIAVTHGPLVVLALPSPVSTLFYEGWVLFLDRGTQGQVSGLYYLYEMVPTYHDFFLGRTLANPRGLLPYEAVNLPYLVCDWHLKSPAGVRCSDPTVFFGEIYANFGLFVSMLFMVLMGVIIQAANNGFRALIERTGSPYYLALFGMVVVYIADFAIGFTTIYFDARLYLILLMYFLPRVRWVGRPPAHVGGALEAAAGA